MSSGQVLTLDISGPNAQIPAGDAGIIRYLLAQSSGAAVGVGEGVWEAPLEREECRSRGGRLGSWYICIANILPGLIP